jgi:hypothetical protein
MEFIDSVHTCTDCGKILVDKEKYFEGKAIREAEEAKAEEERQRQLLESMSDEEKEAVKEALEEAEQENRGRRRDSRRRAPERGAPATASGFRYDAAAAAVPAHIWTAAGRRQSCPGLPLPWDAAS